jgi:hypothetical protein
MKRILFATVALLALTTAGKADVIGTFGINPTSAQGAFSNDPNGPLVGGLFNDFYTFDLVGGPQFVTIASATNTFATGGITGAFGIQNFAAAIFQTVGVPGGGDDILKFGPQFATLDSSGLSQSLNGSGLLDPGSYYLQVAGNAGALAGYGGNFSVAAVPFALLGSGVPGILAILGFGGFSFWRRRNAVG